MTGPWRVIPVVVLLALAGSASLSAQPMSIVPAVPQPIPPMPPDEAEFQELDTVEGSWVNLNHAPIRPMVTTSDFSEIYAVNTHDSTVLHFSGYSAQPAATYRVPWSPVSIALWTHPTDPTDPDRILVVCRGNYCLAMLERVSGKIVGIVPLPSEPGDILLIDDDAYVSCSGADSVVKIDLVAGSVSQTFPIASKHPLFLSRDGNDVLVTPLLSGNNTVVQKIDNARARFADELGILDLSDPLVANIPLPDEDVFRIDSGGTVTAEVSGVGTLLTAHGINPFTGDLWVLNTEANNTGKLANNIAPGVTTEPGVRGVITVNRLTRVDLATGTKTFVELDQRDAQNEILPDRTIGQPYQLTFIPAGAPRAGFAFVVGLLNDRVTVLNRNGGFLLNWDLPDGSIPRAILYDHLSTKAIVYCWGTNEIRVYSLGPASLDVAMDLGHDPAPADVQEGRKTFYDGSHSLSNNASCASCHFDARTDMEEWDLSNDPKDNKGPLVTQTLEGIERVKPFHWRGEQMRGLIDFNGAFDALLGGEPLDEQNGEFANFEKFVFSVNSPANPNMDPRRIINNAFSPPLPNILPPGFTATVGDAVNGQDLWFTFPSVGNATCNFCHSLPTGTNGDIIGDGQTSLHPKRGRLMVTAFNAVWRKFQDLVLVELAFVDDDGNDTFRYPRTGAGFAHSGASNNLLEFTTPTGFDDQQVSDVAAFQTMKDSDVAPATHEAAYLDQASFNTVGLHIATFLIPEADEGDCDLVVFGEVAVDQVMTPMRWAYDRENDVFVPELSSIGAQPWSYFHTLTQSDKARNTFVGMTKGSGFRWGIDFDEDGLPNGDEVAIWNTDPLDKDSDGDGFEDGHEVDNGSLPDDVTSTPTDVTDPTISGLTLVWENTKQAKLRWETSEPTRYTLTFSAPEHDPDDVSSDVFALTHNVILSDLLPSTNNTGPDIVYDGLLTVFDRGNRSASMAIPSIDTLDFTPSGNGVVLTDLDLVGPLIWSVGGDALQANAEATVKDKFQVPNNPPVAGALVIARVLIHRDGQPTSEVSDTFTGSLRFEDFTTGNDANPSPQFLDGPFLFSSVSDAQGRVTFSFGQGGLNPGDRVLLNIEAVVTPPDPFPPVSGNPNVTNLNRWSLPDTKRDSRCLELP